MTERGYLGEVLKELRLERGMSLRALGERAGLSPGYLSALELGRQKNPSLEALCGIAAALGVSITVSCDEPGYIRVSEGSPPCVSVVRSGVPTVREEIEEAKEEAADWRTSDSGMWKPCLTKKRIEMLTPSRSTIPDFKHILAQMEASRSWHQLYQGVPPERDQQEDWDAMKAEMDKDPEQRAMWNAAWRSAPLYGWWKALLAEMEASRSWHQLYQGVPPKRDDDRLMDKLDLVQTLKRGQLCGYIPKDAEGKVWGAIWDKVIQKPVTITNEPGPVQNDAIVASGEGLRVSEVGKWPADYKAPSGGMAEGAVAIGVDLAHGPGKAVTTVWRVQDGKMEMLPPWLTWKPETWRLAIMGDAGTWVELETTSDVVGYAAPGGNAADWTALLMMLRAGTPGRASMRLAWHAELGIFCFRNHREGLATPFRLSRDEAPDVATWLEEELLKLGIKVAMPVLDEAEAP